MPGCSSLKSFTNPLGYSCCPSAAPSPEAVPVSPFLFRPFHDRSWQGTVVSFPFERGRKREDTNLLRCLRELTFDNVWAEECSVSLGRWEHFVVMVFLKGSLEIHFWIRFSSILDLVCSLASCIIKIHFTLRSMTWMRWIPRLLHFLCKNADKVHERAAALTWKTSVLQNICKSWRKLGGGLIITCLYLQVRKPHSLKDFSRLS